MEQSLKRKIAGGAAGLALLAGAGGAAFADTSGSSGRSGSGTPGGGPGYDRDAFLNGVAKRLGVSPEKLKDAIKKEAEEHGGGLPPPLGPPPLGPGPRGHGFHGGPPPLAGPPPAGALPPPGRPPGPPGPILAGLDAAA